MQTKKILKNKANQENMHMECEDNGPSWYNLEFAVEDKKIAYRDHGSK